MFEKFLHIDPKINYLPEYDIKSESGISGVKALMYEGAEFEGKKSAVFAHIGFPETKKGEKVPAVVLVHGGGGRAYAQWVKNWNDHGFAAISMSLRGFVPDEEGKGLLITESQGYKSEKFNYSDEYSALPEGYCIYDENEKIENVWLYLAVANVILAHNVLRSFDEIDNEKIGISGISWGGITTSKVIAYDNRFAFAIPIYGSGNLYTSMSNVGAPFTVGKAKKIWDVSEKYKDIKFPVFWMCWSHDACFDIYPNSLSYLQTKGSGALFAAIEDWYHSHIDGWAREEEYRFAKSIVSGEKPLVKPVTEPEGFGSVSFEISNGENVSAKLYYLTEPMKFNEEKKPDYEWKILPCVVKGNKVSVDIPKDADNYYIELTENFQGENYVTTTSYVKK